MRLGRDDHTDLDQECRTESHGASRLHLNACGSAAIRCRRCYDFFDGTNLSVLLLLLLLAAGRVRHRRLGQVRQFVGIVTIGTCGTARVSESADIIIRNMNTRLDRRSRSSTQK